jgi:DNA replication protein DnaC
VTAELEVHQPPTFDGEVVDEHADIRELMAAKLAARNIDPAVMDEPDDTILDPRGNVWYDRNEAVQHLTEHALRALTVYADGEFDFDRLPPTNEYVEMWAAAHRKDPSTDPLLMLRGTIGCGKTSQLIVLLRDLVLHYVELGRHFRWFFITHRNFAAAMQPGSGRDPDALMHRLMTADLVVLDDLGDFNTQDFGKGADATSRLINHRAHHRLPLVTSSNLPFVRGSKVLEAEERNGKRIAVLGDTLDDRAISRLKSGWTVTMPEIDHRASQGRRFGP